MPYFSVYVQKNKNFSEGVLPILLANIKSQAPNSK